MKLYPVEIALVKQVHTSPIGIIPKLNQQGKYCLIIALTSSHGHSINDRIKPELCSLEYAYVHVDHSDKLLLLCSEGALMGKLDLKKCLLHGTSVFTLR